MSKKNIVIEPDPILRKKSKNLEKVDNELTLNGLIHIYNINKS